MADITVDATLENIQTVTNFVDAELEKKACSMKAQMQIAIAIDELFSNIALYAYAPKAGKATVSITFEKNSSVASITFIDQGIPYNPLKKKDPDITLSAEDRELGGLGIFMVKKTMDSIDYRYEEGQNKLTIRKTIS